MLLNSKTLQGLIKNENFNFYKRDFTYSLSPSTSPPVMQYTKSLNFVVREQNMLQSAIPGDCRGLQHQYDIIFD